MQRTEAIPGKLFDRKALEKPKAAPAACSACHDSGIVTLDAPAAEPMQQFAACTCRAGDEWRQLLAAAHEPPACRDCGRAASFCLTSSSPRCLPCERAWNRRRRKLELPVEVREVGS